jgi:hypothetical protein
MRVVRAGPQSQGKVARTSGAKAATRGLPARAPAVAAAGPVQAAAAAAAGSARGRQYGADAGAAALAAGRPLEPGVRRRHEPLLGHDLGRVRVHTDADRTGPASRLGARAFAHGADVAFAPGEYRPGTPGGAALLAHELAHVVQQAGTAPAQSVAAGQAESQARAAAASLLGGLPARGLGRSPVAVQLQSRTGQRPTTGTSTRPPEDPAHFVTRLLGMGAGAAAPLLDGFLTSRPTDAEAVVNLLLDRSLASPRGRGPGLLARAVATGGAAVERMLTDLETRLVAGSVAADAPPVVSAALGGNPRRLHVIEGRLWTATQPIRDRLETALDEMWQGYERAAYLHAVVTWLEQRLERARNHRPRRVDDVWLEVMLRERLQRARGQYRAEVRGRAARTRAVVAALADLRRASGPLFHVQATELRRLSQVALSSLGRAQRNRTFLRGLRGMSDAGIGTYVQARADRSVAPHRHQPREGRGRARTAIEGGLGALDWRRADPDAPAADWSADRLRQTRDEELEAMAHQRDAALEPGLSGIGGTEGIPTRPGQTRDDMNWEIYELAQQDLLHGFDSFRHELQATGLLEARRSTSANVMRSAGIDAGGSSIGTYAGHGYGQYDLNVPAGSEVHAVSPREVDLGAVLENPSGGRFSAHVYELVGTRRLTPSRSSMDQDTFDKIAFGFFGRGWRAEAIERWLSGSPAERTRMPPRRPNGTAVAGLMFTGTVSGPAGGGPSPSGIRSALEVAVRRDLALPTTTAVFQNVDASHGDFSQNSAISDQVLAALQARTPGLHRDQARRDAMHAVTDAMARDGDVVDAFTRYLMTPSPTRRFGHSEGNMAVLEHHYRERGGSREAWVRVQYVHMRDLDPSYTEGPLSEASLGQPGATMSGQSLGHAGSSGNADSPHVHMSIEVFAGTGAGRHSIGFIEPIDFFGNAGAMWQPPRSLTPSVVGQPQQQPASRTAPEEPRQ